MPYINKRTYKPKKEKKEGLGYIKDSKWAEFYNSKSWQSLREYKIRQSPLCELCLKRGRAVPATQVHHTFVFGNLKKDEQKWEAFLNYDLLASLCTYHHQLAHKYLKQNNTDYLSLDTIFNLENEEKHEEGIYY